MRLQLTAASLLLAAGVGAQTPDQLGVECALAGGSLAPCVAAAVSSRALLGHAGLLAGLGSEVVGTATTLGTRIGGGPRFAFSIRVAAARLDVPDPTDATGLGASGFSATALSAAVTAGLFDGIRLLPTVGGFMSVDLFVQASALRFPRSEGFESGSRSFTTGVRVGMVREGFTVPGVSVSLSRRFVGNVSIGTSADPVSVVINPSVTSLRANVGKDLYAVEFMAGVGWDHYSGNATLRVTNGLGGSVTRFGDVSGSRRVYFGSAAMTFSILFTLSAEAGWAGGFNPVASYAGSYQTGGRTWFGGLSARLTL